MNISLNIGFCVGVPVEVQVTIFSSVFRNEGGGGSILVHSVQAQVGRQETVKFTRTE